MTVATSVATGTSATDAAAARALLRATAWAELSRKHLAALAALRVHWRLTRCQTAAILWMPVEDVASCEEDDAVPLQPESLERLALADDIDLTIARLLGSEDLVAFWLRMPNTVLAEAPIHALTRPTAQLRQLRWRLRGELADRRSGGAS